MGMRPGLISSVSTSLSTIKTKIATDFVPIGVQYIALAWDGTAPLDNVLAYNFVDVAGAGTTAQGQLQAQLIIALMNSSIGVTLMGVVPPAYWPGADVQPTGGSWAQKLCIYLLIAALFI